MNDQICEVEDIVGLRVVGTQAQFEVKWMGYDSKYNSWKPALALSDCVELVFDFLCRPIYGIEFLDE